MNVVEMCPNSLFYEQDRKADWFLNHTTYSGFLEFSKEYKPMRILEIGVRFGYSLIAMSYYSPKVELIVGIDDEIHTQRSNLAAQFNVMAEVKDKSASVVMIEGNTRKTPIKTLLKKYHVDPVFDVIHIDGDHTTEGCYDDLMQVKELIKHSCNILVDDYTAEPLVSKAVAKFLETEQGHVEVVRKYQSLRGLILLNFHK